MNNIFRKYQIYFLAHLQPMFLIRFIFCKIYAGGLIFTRIDQKCITAITSNPILLVYHFYRNEPALKLSWRNLNSFIHSLIYIYHHTVLTIKKKAATAPGLPPKYSQKWGVIWKIAYLRWGHHEEFCNFHMIYIIWSKI